MQPRRRVAGAAAALALLALLAVIAYAVLSARDRTLYAGDSPYGGVRVVERRDGVRALYTRQGRALQSAVIPGRPLELQLEYTRVGAVGLALVPDSARILFVGLGGGAMPMHARQVLPRSSIDVVEIDPLVVEVAQRYFGFVGDAQLRAHAEDGRAFIERAGPASWDLIVLDAFSDADIPRSLATREFLAAVRSRLRPDGVVVANLWTSSPHYEGMLATYLATFGDVHLVRVGSRAQNIVVAHPAPGRFTRDSLVARAGDLAARADPGFDLPALVAHGHRRPVPPRSAVLRDSQDPP
jgi:spermidine synthase